MKSKEEIEQLANEWTNRIDESYKVLLKSVYIEAYTQCQEDMAKPNPKLIDSMAMRYRHDFGLLDKQKQDGIRTTMTQLWEEVVCKGFYKY